MRTIEVPENGDICHLKSGGPKMTVVAVNAPGSIYNTKTDSYTQSPESFVKAAYFAHSGGPLSEATFPISALIFDKS